MKKDLKKAVEYFKLAADQDSSIAQLALAKCYENGNGVDKDLKEGHGTLSTVSNEW